MHTDWQVARRVKGHASELVCKTSGFLATPTCLMPGESIVTEDMKNTAFIVMKHKVETPKSYSWALLVR
jgi:hypothetical protein